MPKIVVDKYNNWIYSGPRLKLKGWRITNMITDKTKQALDEARRDRAAKTAKGHRREMDDESINAKHLRIRGTLDYKFPPPEASCKTGCGAGDDKLNKKTSDHRCVLAIGHQGNCMWSWECLMMRGSEQ